MTTQHNPDLAKVEQVDREAAADLCWRNGQKNTVVARYRAGENDSTVMVQAFARHRAATEDREGVAPGWVMVPREPTEAMLEAGGECFGDSMTADVWTALLSAAPATPEAPTREGEKHVPERLAARMGAEFVARDRPIPAGDLEASQAESYRNMHEIATKELGYPSILGALEAAPVAEGQIRVRSPNGGDAFPVGGESWTVGSLNGYSTSLTADGASTRVPFSMTPTPGSHMDVMQSGSLSTREEPAGDLEAALERVREASATSLPVTHLATSDLRLILAALSQSSALREALGKAVVFAAYSRKDPLSIRLEFACDEDRVAAADAIDEALK